MSLLSYYELHGLVLDGAITNVEPDQINGTSIDITVGNVFLMESPSTPDGGRPVARLGDTKETRIPLHTKEIRLEKGQHLRLRPGQVVLAQSEQVFNLPEDISAEFMLKSSVGRVFLNHMKAGWCDPHWNGSVLTMEFKNDTQYHDIEIPVGVRIGQMVFQRSAPVPADKGYGQRGRYNGDTEVKGAKP